MDREFDTAWEAHGYARQIAKRAGWSFNMDIDIYSGVDGKRGYIETIKAPPLPKNWNELLPPLKETPTKPPTEEELEEIEMDRVEVRELMDKNRAARPTHMGETCLT